MIKNTPYGSKSLSDSRQTPDSCLAIGTNRRPPPARLVFLNDALGHPAHLPPGGRRTRLGNLAIQRLAHAHQLLEPGLRIGAVQQRPMTRAPGTLGLLRDRSLEIDHPAAAGEFAAIVGVQDRTAAGGEHDARAGGEFGDDLALAAAEARFTLALEDQRDIGAAAPLDLVVAIVERIVEHPRQAFGHRGLARAHRADEKDTVLAEHPVLRVPRSTSYRAGWWRSRAAVEHHCQQVVAVLAPVPALFADENCLPVLSTLKYWHWRSASWMRTAQRWSRSRRRAFTESDRFAPPARRRTPT